MGLGPVLVIFFPPPDWQTQHRRTQHWKPAGDIFKRMLNSLARNRLADIRVCDEVSALGALPSCSHNKKLPGSAMILIMATRSVSEKVQADGAEGGRS